jgi:DNA-binding NarL/FixJ family response regulator
LHRSANDAENPHVVADGGARTQTRVVIVDDHPGFVSALTALLESDGRFDIVGTAGAGARAAAVVERVVPDLVLMDVLMPDGHGLQAIRRLRALRPRLRVVVVTAFDDPTLERQTREAGAVGFVSKAQRPEEVLRAVVAAVEGTG